MFFRNALFVLTGVVLWSAVTAMASESFPDLEDDSPSRIQRDLEAFAREYLALSKPTSTRMTTMHYKLELLEKRVERLGGVSNPMLKQTFGLIREFKPVLKERAKEEAERRANETKPYVFDSISGPTSREGGHSVKGLVYLKYEVDEFVKHFRQLKNTQFSHNEIYLDHSRSYFRRTIESSISTAKRLIEKPKPDNLIIVGHSAGSIVLDNYSPQENLQWAINVARIASYFESRIGGSPAEWREWERKIQAVATTYRIKLE